jgi:hypothetical protein
VRSNESGVRTTWSKPIDFALWALCRDGLEAGDFTAHGPGNAQLRRLGLTEGIWMDWLRRLAIEFARQGVSAIFGVPLDRESSQELSIEDLVQTARQYRPIEDPMRGVGQPDWRLNPVLACQGPSALLERLTAWFVEDYRPIDAAGVNSDRV